MIKGLRMVYEGEKRNERKKMKEIKGIKGLMVDRHELWGRVFDLN